jgi:hypothetical protein
MGLTDHERKVLAEMEAALGAEDPKLQSTLTGKARTKESSKALVGVVTFLLGLLTLVTALVAKSTPIGVVAFLLSLIGLILILGNLNIGGVSARGPKKAKRPGWSASLNERWDQRGEDR